VRLTRADRGKATTLAPVGVPARHARGVTYPIRTGRRGCRTASGRSSIRRAGVISKSWARKFEDPIPLRRGRQIVTLEDAGTYITKLSKAEHEATEWQAAMEALILVATLGGPTMFARIGVMRALNRHVVREFSLSRKDPPIPMCGATTITPFRSLRPSLHLAQ
jgi:hypothetical protein